MPLLTQGELNQTPILKLFTPFMSPNNIKRFALVFVAFASVFLLVNYNLLLNKKKNQAEENAKKINAILSENFEHVERMLNFVGKKISQDTPELNLNKIHKIFVQSSNIYGPENILSWSLFDWVDFKGYETVSTMFGIRKDAPYLAPERSYFNRGNELWKIAFSKAAIGNPSGVYIIPIGIQIDTKKHPRAGTVAAGISIKKVAGVIESSLENDVRFMVLDQRDGRFVFGSYESEKYFGRIFRTSPQSTDDENYIYKQNMEQKYPYAILVGYDKKDFWREVFYSSLLLITQVVGVAVCVIYVQRRKALFEKEGG